MTVEEMIARSGSWAKDPEKYGSRWTMTDYVSLSQEENAFFSKLFSELNDKQFAGVCAMMMTESFNRSAAREGLVEYKKVSLNKE